MMPLTGNLACFTKLVQEYPSNLMDTCIGDSFGSHDNMFEKKGRLTEPLFHSRRIVHNSSIFSGIQVRKNFSK